MQTDRSEIAGIFPSNFVEPIGEGAQGSAVADLSFAPQTDASASASSVDFAFDTATQESDSSLNVPSFRH